jgi:hypothetical protein
MAVDLGAVAFRFGARVPDHMDIDGRRIFIGRQRHSLPVARHRAHDMQRQRADAEAGDDHAAHLLEIGRGADDAVIELCLGAHQRHRAQRVVIWSVTKLTEEWPARSAGQASRPNSGWAGRRTGRRTPGRGGGIRAAGCAPHKADGEGSAPGQHGGERARGWPWTSMDSVARGWAGVKRASASSSSGQTTWLAMAMRTWPLHLVGHVAHQRAEPEDGTLNVDASR